MVVIRVEPGSAAESYEVRSGDIVLEVNKIKIASLEDYNKAVKGLKKGDTVLLFIKRGPESIYLAFGL